MMATTLLTAKQAITELEKGKAKPVYYLYGEEPFKIQEFVEKLCALAFGEDPSKFESSAALEKSFSFCIDRLDGASSTGGDVLEAIQSIGLFGSAQSGGRRVVLVRQAHQMKDVDTLAKPLFDSAPESPWGENILVLIADSLDGRRKFHQWLKKQGFTLEFKPARDAELLQWVQYLAKKRNLNIAPEAAQVLAAQSEGSLYRLAQEIEKAWLFAGASPNLSLSLEHIAAVSSYQGSFEMVELVRAILESKRTRALLLAEKLVRTPEEALGLVGFLTWAVKNPGRGFAGTIVGGRQRAERLVGALVDLDERLKTSGLDAPALIEEFVISQSR
ncbi:MAG: DNA polymerase III subunit delta [Bdellovibrionota bacterium]